LTLVFELGIIKVVLCLLKLYCMYIFALINSRGGGLWTFNNH